MQVKSKSRYSADEIEAMIASNFQVQAGDEDEDEIPSDTEEDGQGESGEGVPEDDDENLPVVTEDEGDEDEIPPVDDDEGSSEGDEGDESHPSQEEDEADAAVLANMPVRYVQAEDEDEDDADSDNAEDEDDNLPEGNDDESFRDEDADGEGDDLTEADAAFYEAMASEDDDIVSTLIATGAVLAFKPAFSHEDADIERAMNHAIAAGVFSDNCRVIADDEESEEGTSTDEEEEMLPPVDDNENSGEYTPESDDSEEAPVTTEDDDEIPPVEDYDDDDEDEAEATVRQAASEDDEDYKPEDNEDSDNVTDDEDAEICKPDADEDEAEASVDEDQEMITPVVSMEEVEASSADEISLEFFEDAGAKSHWNVTIAGRPAAMIHSDSVAPETLEFFVKPQFGNSVVAAMRSEGVANVLHGMHAEFFATGYLASEMASEIRASVEQEASTTLAERTAEIHETLVENAILASNGYDKNMWPGVTNALKAKLFETVTAAGLDEAATVDAIETAFAEKSGEYFQDVMAKAVELVSMPQEARDVLAAKINEAGILPTVSDLSADREEIATASVSTFAQALTTGRGAEQFVGASVEDAADTQIGASLRRHLGRFMNAANQ